MARRKKTSKKGGGFKKFAKALAKVNVAGGKFSWFKKRVSEKQMNHRLQNFYKAHPDLRGYLKAKKIKNAKLK